jgi:hypothetical protein
MHSEENVLDPAKLFELIHSPFRKILGHYFRPKIIYKISFANPEHSTL